MDSRIGLDYIVENKEYISKLASALDTNNVTVKKQVFELLSALCVYSGDGYTRTLDTMEYYKSLKGERYRFHVVLSELQKATSVEYRTALVAFVNCIIISTPQLKDRIRIRNEFIGLKLLNAINELRKDANVDPDLAVQLDVFDEQRESDESQLQGPEGVDINSHLDVFYAILRQVADTPQEIPFLSLLQHLLRIDPKEPVSDLMWDTAETLVHRATLLESKEESARLLRSPSHARSLTKLKTGTEGGKCFCTCHRDDSRSRKQSMNLTLSPPGSNSPAAIMSPILSPSGPPPPPPPPLPPGTGPKTGPPAPPPPPGMPPPPPPPPGFAGSKPPGPPPPPLLGPPPPMNYGNKTEIDVEKIKLPQQEIPKPKAKMKTLNWAKLPNNKVVGKNNIWTMVAKSHETSPMVDMDWAEMEGLFCQQNVAPPSTTGTNKGTNLPGTPDSERKRKEPTEITLLDGKRSLNINIFLKQFRSSNGDIVELIREGAHDDIGTEKLRGLLKILPTNDEVEMLRAFDGDRTRLGNAEKFLLQLSEIPNYKLRIEAMLLKEEFAANMGYLEPSINAMIMVAQELKDNRHLQDILYMIVVAGNFLNAGGYAGNAAGVKLASLQKLTDIRANKPGMNLIHYVALQAEKKDKKLLKMPDEMAVLDEATKTTVDQLRNEVVALDSRIKRLHSHIEQPSTPSDIRSQMGEFLKMASSEVSVLLEDLEELERVRLDLAHFFCEEAENFKLEECFKLFANFCQRFRQAVVDNERRRQQEAVADLRRKQREDQLALKRRQSSGPQGSFSGSESENNVMDSLLFDIRTGFQMRKNGDKDYKGRKSKKSTLDFPNGIVSEDESASVVMSSPRFSRRRLGSFSNPSAAVAGVTTDPNVSLNRGDESLILPEDVTPNGTLRRRRSRVPSEEDEASLMDYLRAAGHDGSRERKSMGNIMDGYGSLDRSWARRSRGSTAGLNGGKRRPDLLSADFTGTGGVSQGQPQLELQPQQQSHLNTPSPGHESAGNVSIGSHSATASPAMLRRTPSDLSSSDVEHRSRPWRQKIEAWLQDSDKDSREREESKAKEIRRRLQEHRRSLEFDSRDPENGLKGPGLDPLPEIVSPESKTRRTWRPAIDSTDVVGVMEAIEDAAVPVKDKSPWRKSNLNVSSEENSEGNRRPRRVASRNNTEDVVAEPQQGEQDQRKAMIESLGRRPSQDKLTLYIRQPDQEEKTPVPSPVTTSDGREPSPLKESTPLQVPSGNNASLRRKSWGPTSTEEAAADSASSRLIHKYRQSMDVPTDILKTIEEVEKEKAFFEHSAETHDRVPASLPTLANTGPSGEASQSEREKKRYQRTMTPNTLRSKLQEKLISNLDRNDLVGTIESIKNSPSSPAPQPPPEPQEDTTGPLPPSVPRRMRKTSRGTLLSSAMEENSIYNDKIEIDSENIETPPVTRRASGTRAFRPLRDLEVIEKEDTEEDSRNTRRTQRYRKLLEQSDAKVPKEVEEEEEGNGDDEMGDGRFDRYSSARRTRRFRRGPEGAEDEQDWELRKSPEGVEAFDVKKKELELEPVGMGHSEPMVAKANGLCNGYENTDLRLQRWQDKLSERYADPANPDKDPGVSEPLDSTPRFRTGRDARSRSRTEIDPHEVQEALRMLRAASAEPERPLVSKAESPASPSTPNWKAKLARRFMPGFEKNDQTPAAHTADARSKSPDKAVDPFLARLTAGPRRERSSLSALRSPSPAAPSKTNPKITEHLRASRSNTGSERPRSAFYTATPALVTPPAGPVVNRAVSSKDVSQTKLQRTASFMRSTAASTAPSSTLTRSASVRMSNAHPSSRTTASSGGLNSETNSVKNKISSGYSSAIKTLTRSLRKNKAGDDGHQPASVAGGKTPARKKSGSPEKESFLSLSRQSSRGSLMGSAAPSRKTSSTSARGNLGSQNPTVVVVGSGGRNKSPSSSTSSLRRSASSASSISPSKVQVQSPSAVTTSGMTAATRSRTPATIIPSSAALTRSASMRSSTASPLHRSGTTLNKGLGTAGAGLGTRSRPSVGGSGGGVGGGASSSSFSFMRPTAASTAKDNINDPVQKVKVTAKSITLQRPRIN